MRQHTGRKKIFGEPMRGGGGRRTLIYKLYEYVPLWSGFQTVSSGIGYRNQIFKCRTGYHFPRN